MKRRNLIPTEEQEMQTVCAWLDLHKICYFHPHNEGMHKVQYRAKMARLGVKPGVPDLIIIDRPSMRLDVRGAVIELKRRKGGVLSPNQDEWLIKFGIRGWLNEVCYGAADAIKTLENWGYGK